MYKFVIVVTLVVLSAVLLNADDSATASGGTLHKTLTKLNSVAEKIPQKVKSIGDGIEVRVENIVHPQPQPYGMVRSTIKGAAELVGSVGRQVGGFASTVTGAARDLGKGTAGAVRTSLRRSLDRLTGKTPTPVTTTTEASSEVVIEASSEPAELVKEQTSEETSAAE